MIVFQGTSQIDGVTPVVVVASGYKSSSKNTKTGGMVQLWILVADESPLKAIYNGNDSAICGNCPHRGDGTGKGRTCYVNVSRAPLAIWKAFERGSYPTSTPEETRALLAGKKVRIGAYGDPAAVPVEFWNTILADVTVSTGYTHQWRAFSEEFAQFVMASCDSEQDKIDATAKGYRTFRVRGIDDTTKMKDEVVCPASEEAGKKLTCEQCGACSGNRTNRKSNIVLSVHGAGKKNFKTLTMQA